MKIRSIGILLFILSIIVYTWYTLSSEKYTKGDLLLTNHVRFSGRIIAYDKSTNHAYGIIKIKVTETNTKAFVDSTSSRLFPYKIKGGYAEFYGYIPVSVKVGHLILLDSDKRKLEISDNNNFIIGSDVRISSDKDNLAFVKLHTMFR